nr:immunoglobulin light chain junction region [Macaca mulatta]
DYYCCSYTTNNNWLF